MIEHSVETTLKIFDLLVTIVKLEGSISYFDEYTYVITWDEGVDMLVYQVQHEGKNVGTIGQHMFIGNDFLNCVVDYALSMGIE